MTPRLPAALSALALAACGPGTDDTNTDPKPFVLPTPKALTLSANGPDQLQSAVAGPDGTFYAAGFAAADVAGSAARTVVLMKLGAAGPDTSWGGGDGLAETPLAFKGGNGEIELVVQPTGKIVVAATVANAANPDDRDLALARLNADGSLDGVFGDAGVRVLDLNAGVVVEGKMTATDALRSIALDAAGRIYLHAVQRGEGEDRKDTDFAVVRLTADGALDTQFGTNGKHLLDIKGSAPNLARSNATAHGIHVLPDGSIIANGYATTEGVGTGAQPVLYKLDDKGALVPGFATNGLFHESVLATQTEIYNVAIHGNHVVTGGYGRDSGEQNDWVSMRFDATTGARDTTWGGAAKGAVTIDPTGNKVGDNCRNAIALPGGGTALVGSVGPGNTPEQDAALAFLDANGRLDTKYGTGVHVRALGEGKGGSDQFWGGAVSGSNLLLVGFKGGGAAASQSATQNDDAYMLVVPLR